MVVVVVALNTEGLLWSNQYLQRQKVTTGDLQEIEYESSDDEDEEIASGSSKKSTGLLGSFMNM